MRSIQDVGAEILTNNPKHLYIFLGCEYGIKLKYLDHLKSYYHGNYIPYEDIDSLLKLLSTKRLIPISNGLYVVRYDDTFISNLNSSYVNKLLDCNIPGTLVMIYESKKHAKKLCKYLDDYCVSIDSFSDKFMFKYLRLDFPELPDNIINSVIKCGTDYYQCKLMCSCLSYLKLEDLIKLDDDSIFKLFGKDVSSNFDQLRIGVASRNCRLCSSVLSNYSDMSTIYYDFLQVLLELDNLVSNKYAKSNLRDYLRYWSVDNIYNMYCQVYHQLMLSRSFNIDIELSMLYLISLLQFKQIPTLEVLS